MRAIDIRIDEFASRQHGVVSRDQLLTVGSRQQIGRRLAAGRLVRVHDSVYRLPSAAPTWQQALLAACLAGGKSSVASFRAAAFLHGLPGGAEVVEITTLRHHRWPYPHVLVHESRHLSELDVMIIDSIPVTRAARTLCDLAGLVELYALDRRTLDLALLECVRRNLVDVRSVWRAQERLGGSVRLGGEIILDALQHFVPPERSAESRAETQLLQLLREHELPEPVAQFWLALPNDERIRLDFAWPGLSVGAEFDPYKFHGDRERYERNASRTRLMQALGWDRVTITDDDLDAGIPEGAAALRTLLQRRSA
jgi:hypothetical protein